MVSLALDPPPSRGAPRHRGLRRVLLALALGAALGVGFWLGRVTAGEGWAGGTRGATANPTAGSTSTSTSNPTATSTSNPTSTSTATATASPTATANPIANAAPLRRLVATLSGPLEDSIARAMAREDRGLAEELTQVVNRLLVWEFQVARDGRKGDRLEVLWSPPRAAAEGLPATGEPLVEAVRYASSKLGSVLAVYRFQPEGARWPRYYRADGTEVEQRLVDGPIADYEQVSSLLRDGRRHKGVDFKAPVGSPVRAPFDGTVVRRNWNFAANGNCLEVRDAASGRRALFLHLESVPRELGAGRAVRRGEVIAASGNTGRSFAPHLHYQLEDAAGKVLDPFDVHRTERRALAPAERAAFDAERARLDAAFAG